MKSASWAVALLAASLGLGCYNPNIVEGGLKCAPDRVCPDDFQCASDGRCYRRVDAGRDTGAAICTSPTPAALCSRDPGAGACDPACNAGCTCGWCGIDSNGVAACLTGTPGTKTVGEVCDPSHTSDCQLGLRCRSESCGGVGRCYKFCDSNADCPTQGTSCSVSGGTLCSLPDPGCDPVTMMGCPSGFACYPTGNTAYCDCAGSVPGGGSCMFTHDCVAGYGCVGPSNAAICKKVCKANTDCGAVGICTPAGTYGYCL